MTPSQRRRARREKKSHFQRIDIMNAVEGDVRSMRQQIAAQRNRIAPQLVTDEARIEAAKNTAGWAYDNATGSKRPRIISVARD